MSRPADPHAKIDLLRAAEAVFVERGLDDAKVEEITARAGRSKGAFYLHFASKEDAFRQIVETFLARLAVHVDDPALLADKSRDPGAVLAEWHDKDVEILEFIWQNRGLVRLMLEGGGSRQFGYLIDEFAERTRGTTVRLLRWGVDAGLYRADLDVEMASLVIAGAWDRLVRHLVRRERKPDLDTLSLEMQRLILGGIAGKRLVEMIDPKVRNRRSKRA